MLIELVIGDWSWDGHNQTERHYYEINCDKEELEFAYQAGTGIVGFDLSKQLCHDFEEDSISIAHWYEFIKAGGRTKHQPENISNIDLESYGNDPDDYWDEDGIILTTDLFGEMYLEIARMANPGLEYKRIYPTNRVNIGGYGLFRM